MIEFDGRVKLEDRARLPQCSGIYFVQDDKDNVLYVGKSINIRQRWLSHLRHKQAKELNEAYVAWIVADESVLSDLEEEYIGRLFPKWNGTTEGLSVPKRPAIDEKLYYEMVKASAQVRKSVKQWLTEAIEEKLERQNRSIVDPFVEEDIPRG